MRSLLLVVLVAGAQVSPHAAQSIVPCTFMSVERDATFCVPGPVCSGDGDVPAGVNCPKKEASAIGDCHFLLKSHVRSSVCEAPVDATCRKIHTGA